MLSLLQCKARVESNSKHRNLINMTDGNKMELLLRLAFTLLLFALLEKGVHGQCSTPPINQAIYEGTLDTLMICNRQVNTIWQVISASDELSTTAITNSSDTVYPSYTGIYGANQTGLTIKMATTTPGTDPFATAGLYIVKNTTTVRRGAKLLVVREGPTCTCNETNSTSLQMSCSVKYADSSFHPINAFMTWTSNGDFYSSNTSFRSRADTYWFESTSTITVDADVPANYQCNVTFEKPTLIQYAWIATNAPAFTATCNSPFCHRATTTWTTSTTEPPTTTSPTSTTEPPTTTWPMTTTKSSTTTMSSTISTMPSTTECHCPSCPTCPPPDRYQNCTQDNQCWSYEANLTKIYNECVVKAELYAKCDSCYQDALLCGVVVTLRNESRWLIHDPLCDDGKCEMAAVNASCMSSQWKLLDEKKIIESGVGDYIKEGSIVNATITDCSESCKRMMSLP